MVHAPCDLGVNMMSSPNAVSGSIGAGGPMGWGSFSRVKKNVLMEASNHKATCTQADGGPPQEHTQVTRLQCVPLLRAQELHVLVCWQNHDTIIVPHLVSSGSWYRYIWTHRLIRTVLAKRVVHIDTVSMSVSAPLPGDRLFLAPQYMIP